MSEATLAGGEACPIPDDQVSEEWKRINIEKRDPGKWWDCRVVITSGEKAAGVVACSDPRMRQSLRGREAAE